MKLYTITTFTFLVFSVVDTSAVAAKTDRSRDDGRHGQERNKTDEGTDYEHQQEVMVSQKCGAVLLAAGTGLGGALAYALAPAMMCSATGFCHVGVAKGSLAAMWQSTMKTVTAASTFAQLQSVAMGGAGIYTTFTGGMVGGTTVVYFLQNVCRTVDEAEPDSVQGKLFDGAVAVVTAAIEAKDKVKGECSSSKPCQEAVEMATKTLSTIYQTKGAMEFVKTTCASNDDCVNAAERIQNAIDEKSEHFHGAMEQIMPAVGKTTQALFDALKQFQESAVKEVMPVAENAARGTIETMKQVKDACAMNEVCKTATGQVQTAEKYVIDAATETYNALMKKWTTYSASEDEL